MLCILDIDCSDRTRAAKEIQALFELALPTAQRQAKELPSLYKSGVRYRKQPTQACAFRNPKDVYERKGGDCKQLVLWRLAELRNAGEQATVQILWLADKDGFSAHARVRRADKSIEDPSVALGMKGVK